MTQATAPVLSDITQALCAALILMVPLAAAGLALTQAGLGRSRSAAHAMLGSLCIQTITSRAGTRKAWLRHWFLHGSRRRHWRSRTFNLEFFRITQDG